MIKTTLSTVMSKLLDISENGYYRWKSKDHTKLINLIETYHSKEDLEEFLETGKIQKQEMIKDLSLNDLKNMKEFKNQLILDEISRTEEKLETLKKQLKE